MTPPEGATYTQAAIREMPQVARRFANAVAADVENDDDAVTAFAAWVADNRVRVHALVILACVTAAAADWGADTMRAYAATQEATTRRGRK